MPIEATWQDRERAIEHLKIQVGNVQHWQPEMFRPMTPEQKMAFNRCHPGAHFVIGDFEIKCLKPEKYNL